jgi:proton glutamate symport protein
MRLTLGYQVLLAVIAGIFAGLFLGPLTAFFRPIGSIYVMLLQMVVLPYICFSIILGLGSLTPSHAKKLFQKGWPFWVLLWGLVFLFIYLFCQLIPTPLAASFLQSTPSAAELREALAKNILAYLIPENPIYAFLNNIVPAIAVFGLIVGFSLMHLEKKEPLLSLVERGDQIIEKILEWLALISPIGVFAHISVVMGTVHLSDLYKIDFYLISYVSITLFFTFWLLPLILSSLTSLSFRESLHAFRSVCLLSFVTGIPTIAIPFINRYLRKLGDREPLKGESGYRTTVQTVVPISYSFAQIGNALLLFFILFASFYYRHPFTASEKSLLSLLTIPLSVGSPGTSVNSISFLFNELKFPDNAVELFTATMPVTVNFQALLSAASILTFILLVIFANYHLMQIKWKSLLFKVMGSVAVAGAIILAVRPFVHLDDNFRYLYPNRTIAETLEDPVKAKVYLPGEPLDYLSGTDPKEGVMERIFRTNVLRVGYDPGSIPYAYWNRQKDLVGFDIAMAYQLAKDLNCKLEFIPLDIDQLTEELNKGVYDIAMSAILMSEDRIQKMSFTAAYTDQNNALLIPESKRPLFKSLSQAQENKKLVIGSEGGYKRIFAQNFPNAIAYRGPFEQGIPQEEIDAWIWSRIPGTVWCLNNPGFYVEDFDGQLGKCYFAYPVRIDVLKFLRFANNWLELKNLDGFYKDQENYWIYGKSPSKAGEPRWSIIRNVLHWIK